ncbi:hypothetical protein BCR34DRAFT_582330 [Clohesyomyces aquaticus]|uniref:RING-type domain-containing protein n=1 Tax=Clohesyomyces aquaticus TaxID=1231657 RepID=A0A1Y2A9E8_9PLEO|nr:hypothetical protein BCR34DRAFT_582330 [Clohesyomyces aquaticus]
MDFSNEKVVSVWGTLHEIGGKLYAKGENLTTRRQRIRDCPTCYLTQEDYEINLALVLAEQEHAHLKEEFELWESKSDDEERGRMIRYYSLLIRAAEIRLADGCVGKLKGIRKQSKQSGLAQDVRGAIDDFEHRIACLREWEEQIAEKANELVRDVRSRICKGEIVFDSVFGYIEVDPLVNVGPETKVTDISIPVSWIDASTDRCPICIDHFGGSHGAVRLICGHLAGGNCLETWINTTANRCNTCPLCRTELFPRRQRQPSQYFDRIRAIDSWNVNNALEVYSVRCLVHELADVLKEIGPELIADSLGQ